MTTVLLAAVAILATVLAVDLLLTSAVLRRLKQLESDRPAAPATAAHVSGRVAGSPHAWTTPTRTGHPVLDSLRHGETLLAFTSPGCLGCTNIHDDLVAVAAGRSAQDQRTLVVVAAEDADTATYRADFGGTAEVVADGMVDGTIAAAFGVDAYPTFVLVREGEVVASGSALHDVGYDRAHR